MSLHSIRAAARLFRPLAAIALGLSAAACGGGGGEEAAERSSGPRAKAAHAVAAPVSAPVSVMVEGCVLDRHYIPTTGTPVRALSADGRLLGNALSDGQGRFTLRVPAHTTGGEGSEVMPQIDRPQGESLPLRLGAASTTRANCLLDDQA